MKKMFKVNFFSYRLEKIVKCNFYQLRLARLEKSTCNNKANWLWILAGTVLFVCVAGRRFNTLQVLYSSKSSNWPPNSYLDSQEEKTLCVQFGSWCIHSCLRCCCVWHILKWHKILKFCSSHFSTTALVKGMFI